MRRIIIICEGRTEQEFCKTILQPFFVSKNIKIDAPIIKKSDGGIVNWSTLKKQIESHLKNERAYVTTFIDYYGLCAKHQFPRWDDAHKMQDKNDIMNTLEDAMKNDIDKKLSYRFLPYIQLHEFEALLFSNKDVLKKQCFEERLKQFELEEIFTECGDCPEMINNVKETSPSHRLKKLIKG